MYLGGLINIHTLIHPSLISFGISTVALSIYLHGFVYSYCTKQTRKQTNTTNMIASISPLQSIGLGGEDGCLRGSAVTVICDGDDRL